MSALPAWLLVLLTWMAVHRLTRLVTADGLTEPLRLAVQRRLGPPEESKLTYLVTCDWCVSVWVGAAAAPVVVLWPDNRVVVAGLIALSASAFAGNIVRLES